MTVIAIEGIERAEHRLRSLRCCSLFPHLDPARRSSNLTLYVAIARPHIWPKGPARPGRSALFSSISQCTHILLLIAETGHPEAPSSPFHLGTVIIGDDVRAPMRKGFSCVDQQFREWVSIVEASFHHWPDSRIHLH